jgi:hypothetical protein
MSNIELKRSGASIAGDIIGTICKIQHLVGSCWRSNEVLFVGGVMNQIENLDNISGGVRLGKLGEILVKLHLQGLPSTQPALQLGDMQRQYLEAFNPAASSTAGSAKTTAAKAKSK